MQSNVVDFNIIYLNVYSDVGDIKATLIKTIELSQPSNSDKDKDYSNDKFGKAPTKSLGRPSGFRRFVLSTFVSTDTYCCSILDDLHDSNDDNDKKKSSGDDDIGTPESLFPFIFF